MKFAKTYRLIAFIGISIFCIVLNSCEKDYSDESDSVRELNPFETCTGCSYFPVCDGIIYSFKDSVSILGLPGTSILRNDTMKINSDLVLNGVRARSIKESTGSTIVTCRGGVVTLYETNLLNNDTIKSIPLKYNAALNETWKDTIKEFSSGFGVDVFNTRKLFFKSTSKVVDGITYTDVIGVETRGTNSINPLLNYVSKEYYARNIGLVESEIVMGPATFRSYLKFYQIP